MDAKEIAVLARASGEELWNVEILKNGGAGAHASIPRELLAQIKDVCLQFYCEGAVYGMRAGVEHTLKSIRSEARRRGL